MSSIASRQYDPPRSRLPSVVLLAILLVAMPAAMRAQLKATKRTAASQQPAAPPQDTASKRTAPARQDTASAPRESTFVQKLLTAIVTGLAAKDTASQPPVKRQAQALMPNVVGMDTASALERLGLATRARTPLLSYVIVPPPATLIAVDQIAEQSPAARTPVSRGMTVRLTLAGVPRPTVLVTVPNVLGLPEQRAADTLRALGLVEDRLEKRAATPADVGRVTGQNPAGGRSVAVGAVVAIAIGQGASVTPPTAAENTPRPPTTAARTIVMPRVVGLDSRSALRILRDSGLRNLRFRVPVNATAVDTVRAQSPDSGQRIRPTSAVVLTLAVRVPVDPPALPPLPDPVPVSPGWWSWVAPAAMALAFLLAAALTARTVLPPPQIVPQIRIEPSFTDVLGHTGGLVDVSVSLRSHVEREQATLDLTGAPNA